MEGIVTLHKKYVQEESTGLQGNLHVTGEILTTS
jgi:hypothetical protein